MKKFVANNHIKNSPVNIDDIDRAEFIYGPVIPTLQGKMTRTNPVSKQTVHVPLPIPMLQHHKHVDLYCDFFFVNKIPFLHTKSKNINFLSVQYCKSRSGYTIKQGLKYVKSKYEHRGFVVQHLHADNEFNIDGLENILKGTKIHIYAAKEHVGIIERSIRTIKERCRCISHAMPFKRHTKLMTKTMIEFVVSRLNAVPANDGISDTLSPRTIVMDDGAIDLKYKSLEYGSHVLLYTTTLNNMKRRSIPCISLNPTNDFGGHNFMSLETGKKLHGYRWQELPMDDWVINRVEELAKKEGQPKLIDKTPIFEWHHGETIYDNDEDSIFRGEGNNEDDSEVDHSHIAEIDEEGEPNDIEVAVITDNGSISTNNDHSSDDDDASWNDLDELHDSPDDEHNEVQSTSESTQNNPKDDEDIDIPIEAYEDDTNDILDGNVNEENIHDRRRSLRSNKGKSAKILEMSFSGKSYNKSKSLQFLIRAKKLSRMTAKNRNRSCIRSIQFMQRNGKETDNHKDNNGVMQTSINVLFTQMSAKEGFKKVGEEAIAAIFKEYKQLNDGPMPGNP